jgi:hypothetical protein
MKNKNFYNLSIPAFISVVVLALYYTWFVVLDRELIFLYGHLNATPFDASTSSRYWMTGLVAGGVILLVFTLLNLIIKKFDSNFQIPDWSKIWKKSSLIFSLPVLLILTVLGEPKITFILSVRILLVLTTALALALYAASYLLNNLRGSIWAFLDGLGIMPLLIFIPSLIDYGIRKSLPVLLFVAPLVIILSGLGWSLFVTFLYKRFKQPFTSPINILLSGLVTSYLLLPLLHYVSSRPGYVRYISNSANFFSNDIRFQAITFIIVMIVPWTVNNLRQKSFTTKGR